MLTHHKGKELSKNDMLKVLRQLDDCLDGMQRKVRLYGLGGTVLVLSELRYQSKDADFIVSREDFRVLSGHISEMEWKEKIQFDLFPNGLLPDYQYSEYAVNAKRASFQFKNIELFYLDAIDLVLTKALAGRTRDFEDIHLIAQSEKNIPKEELIKRFKKVLPAPNKKEEIKTKFERFVSEFYKK